MDRIRRSRPFHARRQRRIERRRREIIEAAARIFAERGYAQTTIREIAAAADLAEGTLYNYFRNKRDILLAILEQMQRPVDVLLEEVQELDSREDFIALVERGLHIFVSQLDFTRTLLAEAWLDDDVLEKFVIARLQHVGSRIRAFVAKRVEGGVFRPMPPELVSQMILGMVLGVTLPVLRGQEDVPSKERCHLLAETVVDLLLDGIRVRGAGA